MGTIARKSSCHFIFGNNISGQDYDRNDGGILDVVLTNYGDLGLVCKVLNKGGINVPVKYIVNDNGTIDL
jgi:hypothetical protein